MAKHWSQISFATIYVLLSLSVVIWSLSDSWRGLLFYTFQGNILCLILMFLDLCSLINGKHLSKSLAKAEFAGTIAILTIGVIYCTLLSDISSRAFWTDIQSLGFHFFFPILFTAYVIIFRRREMPSLRQVFICLIPPIAYIGFVHVRNLILGIKWYPYFFTDISKIGLDGFMKWVGILFVSLLIVGSLFLFICHRTSKSSDRRSWAQKTLH